MILQKNKQYLDRFCFRCRSKAPPHDVKVNIRKNSIFSDIKIPINVIYNLTFNCFLKNMGINKSYIKIHIFCKKLGVSQTNSASIIKLFRILKYFIRINFHKKWESEQMNIEPDISGISRLEIDQSSIIGNASTILWMFGIIDRVSKNARLW